MPFGRDLGGTFIWGFGNKSSFLTVSWGPEKGQSAATRLRSSMGHHRTTSDLKWHFSFRPAIRREGGIRTPCQRKCIGRNGASARCTSSDAFGTHRSPAEIVGPALASVAGGESCIGEADWKQMACEEWMVVEIRAEMRGVGDRGLITMEFLTGRKC